MVARLVSGAASLRRYLIRKKWLIKRKRPKDSA